MTRDPNTLNLRDQSHKPIHTVKDLTGDPLNLRLPIVSSIEYYCPIEEGNHPELDESPSLESDGIRLYWSLNGSLQWDVTLGRFDILIGVTKMSSFRVSPREGHLDRLKRMNGYLKRHPARAVRFRTGIPDHESTNIPTKFD